LVKPLLNPKY
ncbi:unnamed protein product, partial [Rotaria sp. Silwood1]